MFAVLKIIYKKLLYIFKQNQYVIFEFSCGSAAVRKYFKILKNLNANIINKCYRETKKMNKLCRQLSIESPSITGRDCVFSFDVPVPDVPIHGARIRVVCAGACYHPKRSPSLTSLTSVSSSSSLATEASLEGDFPVTLPHHGVRDASLFPGYEVAGIVESLGSGLSDDCGCTVGDRVILYPYEGIPNGYVEYLVVHDLKYLIKIPDNLSLSVAAMLPAGALLAMNTVFAAHEHVQVCKISVSDYYC